MEANSLYSDATHCARPAYSMRGYSSASTTLNMVCGSVMLAIPYMLKDHGGWKNACSIKELVKMQHGREP
ncbi:hypothetical protein [Humibacillus xanthopallidus]|uniref:hypothetical protein n=1 Tax=Humibacillus xanthopallidus TaxID=412689 RepID=UPI001FEAF435|nr:hypothetical protein [Humibacillus xanthopallidus]